MRQAIKCPTCGDTFDYSQSNRCNAGHAIRAVHGVPLCFSEEMFRAKVTADPGYPLPYAVEVAEQLGNFSSYEAGIDAFFARRETELKRDISRERDLIKRRTVDSINGCIADACHFLDKIGRPFPPPSRCHIDVGCGLGFSLASSSKSYFGRNVVGIDLSPHYLVLAKMNLTENGVDGVRLFCADICDGWPMPLQQYDVAFISMEGVLEHIHDLPAFFRSVTMIKSFPFVIYLTVPYRWTVKRESHFDMRFISWLPRSRQDAHIARRLGVDKIDHVEFYSIHSLRRTLEEIFVPGAIQIEKNSANPLQSHYLRGVTYAEGPQSFRL